jgi:WD40 repeat protein
MAHGSQVLSGHTDAVLSVAFAPSSGLLASGSSDGGVRLWETKGWKMVRSPVWKVAQ